MLPEPGGDVSGSRVAPRHLTFPLRYKLCELENEMYDLQFARARARERENAGFILISRNIQIHNFRKLWFLSPLNFNFIMFYRGARPAVHEKSKSRGNFVNSKLSLSLTHLSLAFLLLTKQVYALVLVQKRTECRPLLPSVFSLWHRCIKRREFPRTRVLRLRLTTSSLS